MTKNHRSFEEKKATHSWIKETIPKRSWNKYSYNYKEINKRNTPWHKNKLLLKNVQFVIEELRDQRNANLLEISEKETHYSQVK